MKINKKLFRIIQSIVIITIFFIAFKELYKIFIDIDKVLMQRVLNNLIYNALVHNDKNISIVVSVYKKDKIYISISDNGNGISEKDLENIFDRYYRGTNTGEAHKGSGLGMSIAKEIVNAHNGDITINSILGKGTDINTISYVFKLYKK